MVILWLDYRGSVVHLKILREYSGFSTSQRHLWHKVDYHKKIISACHLEKRKKERKKEEEIKKKKVKALSHKKR